jgi:molybdopterin-containing oxidoreductase family iron-sulfur binding subunit
VAGNLRYARDYAARRREHGQGNGVNVETESKMSRLYVVETTPTITGANADHRFSVKPAEMEAVGQGVSGASIVRAAGDIGKWLPAVSKDLQLHKGASIVIAGDEQSPAVHALAHAANSFLGNVGKTVFYSDPLEANSVDQTQSLRELLGDIDAGKVEVLIIIGGNPAYNTPVDLRLDFNRVDKKVKLRAHLSLFNNETSQICHWHIPMAHYLESWGDARAHDGTVSIVQPLIAPLYEGKTAYEMLALFSDNYDQKPYDMVRVIGALISREPGVRRREPAKQLGDSAASPSPAASQAAECGTDFESTWRKWLPRRIHSEIPRLQSKTVSAKGESGQIRHRKSSNTQPPSPNTFRSRLSARIRQSTTVCFANNGWLQEYWPNPLTKITWDNVALVSAEYGNQARGSRRKNYEERDHARSLCRHDQDNAAQSNDREDRTGRGVMPGQPDRRITLLSRIRAANLSEGLGHHH